jgi:hypothetical protein
LRFVLFSFVMQLHQQADQLVHCPKPRYGLVPI